jgi:GNAT superfamily N-acetyltransferase
MHDESWALPVAGAVIHRAGPEDLDEAADVLEDAARWVQSIGEEAWREGTFTQPNGWGRLSLMAALRTGGLFVAGVDGEAVATVSLLEVDEEYWPGAPPDALYLHKLGVRRSHAGLGIGRAIVEWSADHARTNGKAFLRLDCPASNPWVRAYYEAAGFVHRGDVVVGERRFHAALYERALGG